MDLILLLAETADSNAGSWKSNIFLWAIIAIFIVFMIYSYFRRKKMMKEEQEKRSTMAVGDKVKTIGGICGEIVQVLEDDTLLIKTGTDEFVSYVTMDKQGIAIFQSPKAFEEDIAELDVPQTENTAENAENAESADGEQVAENAESADGEQVAESVESAEQATEEAQDSVEANVESASEEEIK